MTKAKRSRRERDMSPIHSGAAAIDIGATMHVAAVGSGCDAEPVRSFGTFTADLHRLADWFKQCGIKTVAMESTGVYWIPAFEILEQRGFAVVLINARDANTSLAARPTLPTLNGCSGCMSMGCCEQASSRSAESQLCGIISARGNVCLTMRPPISSTCRRR